VPNSLAAYQAAQANNSYPSPAASSYDLDILFYTQLHPSRPAAAEVDYPMIADFDDDTGPGVGPDETLSAFIIPAFGPVAPVANGGAFVTATLLGGPDDAAGTSGAKMDVRSIARGTLG
jgi:hypothetical protein